MFKDVRANKHLRFDNHVAVLFSVIELYVTKVSRLRRSVLWIFSALLESNMEMIIKTDQQGNLKYNFLAQIYVSISRLLSS